MRWAIRYYDPKWNEGALIPGTHDDRAEAQLRCAEMSALDNGRRYRVVRLVKRSERLQRQLDEAQAELVAARKAIGEVWLRDGRSLADAISRKSSALEGMVRASNKIAARDLDAAVARRRLIDAVLRCTERDLPAEVDEMVRARIRSRDGRDVLTTATAIREFAAILATWLERGAK